MFLSRLQLPALLAICACAAAASPVNLTAFVNPYIGTGGTGWGISEVPPGPQVPFGAMRLSPDTSMGFEPLRVYFENNGGYYFHDRYIECFSHTHVDGAGGQDWENFGVTVTRRLNDAMVTNAGYRSAFTHQGEVMQAGYYAVNLDTPDTLAEVTTCGTHAGRHRYTCRARQPNTVNEPCFLVIDLCHVALRTDAKFDFAKACKSAEILRVTPGPGPAEVTIVATVFSAGAMSHGSSRGGERLWFHAVVTATNSTDGPVFLQPWYWIGGQVIAHATPPNNTATTSHSLGVALQTLQPTDYVVFDVAAAISFVSAASAENNLHATLRRGDGSWVSFDDCRASARQQWEAVLRQVTIADVEAIAATRRDELVTFYTALYHAHLAPTTYSEANGEFMGFDGRVHTLANASTHRHVSDLSLWDTYRSHAPLMILLQPDMARDTVNSMLSMYKLSGDGSFPVWPMANVETDIMVGHHGVILVGDAIQKGVRGIDVASAFDAVVNTVKRQDTEKLGDLNYTPMEQETRSAAKTLDYALDAGAALGLALWLNRTDVAALFRKPSEAYRNIWNSEAQMFCGRHRNGTFDCSNLYLPYPYQGNFVEGNGEEYRWYVPHDPYGLVQLYKSNDFYATQLHEFLNDTFLWPFNITFPNPFFWAGNEPTFLTPYQFNWAGNEYAHLTQHFVPILQDTYFFNGPAGVPGNDDYGAMSSWLVLGYFGLYPAASSPNYTLCVPRFDDVTLSVSAAGALATPFANVGSGGGAVLRLTAYGRPTGAKTGDVYLANASLNGTPLPTPFVTQQQLLDAAATGSVAQITFYLSPEATVFGKAAPSSGGPPPWQPPASSPQLARERVERRMRAREVAQQKLSRGRSRAPRRPRDKEV